jgi:hypothetical protein
MSELEGLLKRVEAASGPDRELDADVLAGVGIPGGWTLDRVTGESKPVPVTGSIDAALALVSRVCGNVSWRVGNKPSGRGFCYLGTDLVEHDGATPILAILAALLKAKIAQTETVLA